MVFESMSHSYEVINLVESRLEYDTYICKSNGKRYILSCIRTENLKLQCCEMFLDYASETDFEEMYGFDGINEIFSFENYLVIVFHEHMLDEKLATYVQDIDGEIYFLEKLRLLRDVMSGLCVHEVPIPVACDLIRSGNVGRMSDGSINAYYDLKDIDLYKEYELSHLISNICESMKGLFRFELRKKKFKDIQIFCKNLEAQPPESMVELYERFRKLYELMEQKERDGAFGSQSGGKKFLALLKKIFGVLKFVLVFGIIIAAVWFLIWSINGDDGKSGGTFSQIGDVKIEEYKK